MLRTIEVKLYLTDAQERTLSGWLRSCCWTYNRALEQRIKAYRRRQASTTYNSQSALLTQWRKGMPALEALPIGFARDALRRVDRGMKAFFRRLKQKNGKAGFPRFRSHRRYNSMEFLAAGRYVRSENLLSIPKLGLVRFRGGNRAIPVQQKLLRVIRRASGWYAQLLYDNGVAAPEAHPVTSSIGIDLGLQSFATLSDGHRIENPRWMRRSERKQRALQRRVSRRKKGSQRRRRAVHRLRRHHERISAQRRNFCHEHSRRLVDRFDLIAVENLNIRGLARSRMAKSIHDAGWSTFLSQLRYKAEEAGSQLVEVDPRYTSQECPSCGAVKAKKLSERWHSCGCGLECDRDHAAAQVILARALGVAGAERSRRDPATVQSVTTGQVGPLKREV